MSFVETSREMSTAAKFPFISEYIRENISPPSSVSYHCFSAVFKAVSFGPLEDLFVDPPVGVPAGLGAYLREVLGAELLDVRPTDCNAEKFHNFQ